MTVYIRPNNLLIGKKVASYWVEGLLSNHFDKQLCTWKLVCNLIPICRIQQNKNNNEEDAFRTREPIKYT